MLRAKGRVAGPGPAVRLDRTPRGRRRAGAGRDVGSFDHALDAATFAPAVKVYTRKGDDGTTGLLYGGRVAKDSPVIDANGAVDEAQAALGVVRAEVERSSELDGLLVRLEGELYVLMADVATAEANRAKLSAGTTLVTAEMVTALEPVIDDLTTRFPPLKDFVIPGHDRVSAGLDVARTAIRRAERLVIGAAAADSRAAAYLNRLSDLVWTMARWQEHGDSLLSRQASRSAALTNEGTDPHG